MAMVDASAGLAGEEVGLKERKKGIRWRLKEMRLLDMNSCRIIV